jgi:hypothetical protein
MSFAGVVAQAVNTNFLSWGLDAIWHGARLFVPQTTTATVVTSLATGALATAGFICIGGSQATQSRSVRAMYKVLTVAEYGSALVLACDGGLSVSIGGYATGISAILAIVGKLGWTHQHIFFPLPPAHFREEAERTLSSDNNFSSAVR